MTLTDPIAVAVSESSRGSCDGLQWNRRGDALGQGSDRQARVDAWVGGHDRSVADQKVSVAVDTTERVDNTA